MFHFDKETALNNIELIRIAQKQEMVLICSNQKTKEYYEFFISRFMLYRHDLDENRLY